MGWRYNNYRPPTVADQRHQALQRIEKLRKKHPDLRPVQIEGNKIAKTWWGVSWCNNLERYADFANRIGRGRSYVKNGFVIDLRIEQSTITALVSGSRIYEVKIGIDPLPEKKWQRILEECAHKIDSIAALTEGSFPEALADVFMRQGDGLFPSPREIRLGCNCPDWAVMCKHVAATLYAVGARLDTDPLLFFTLRGIDPAVLVKKSVDEKMRSLLANAAKKSKRVIADKDAARIFGDVL